MCERLPVRMTEKKRDSERTKGDIVRVSILLWADERGGQQNKASEWNKQKEKRWIGEKGGFIMSVVIYE